jgi:hypothetical protein
MLYRWLFEFGGSMKNTLLLLLALCLSCASGANDVELSGPGGSGKADGETADLSELLATGYHFTLSSSLRISETDDPDPAKTFLLSMSGLVFPHTTDGVTTFTLRPCFVTLPEVSGRTAEIDSSTVENVPTFDMAVELNAVDDDIRLRTSSGVLLAGVELDEPGQDPMPESKRDSRLVDVDEDGQPGMSLNVDGWKVYTAMRIKMMLEGGIEETGVIRGDGTMSIELGMYGDNVPFVDAAAKAKEALEKLQVDDQEHLFVFTPVTSEALGCQAVTPVVIEHNEPGMTDESFDQPFEQSSDEPSDEPADESMNDEPSFGDSESA